jgi:hypothetical protein
VLLVSYLGILSEAAGARRETAACSARPMDACLGAATASPPRAATSSGRLLPAFLIAGSLVTLVRRGRRIHAALNRSRVGSGAAGLDVRALFGNSLVALLLTVHGHWQMLSASVLFSAGARGW